ncbi:MAG: hypothetical protein U9R57_10030 [Thermodesulfobacteriota bacterium]|nr:hypothetical protein [Thermodesulfobacteriota bacterium]
MKTGSIQQYLDITVSYLLSLTAMLSKGVDASMPIIFIGVVVPVLGYTLFTNWFKQATVDQSS